MDSNHRVTESKSDKQHANIAFTPLCMLAYSAIILALGVLIGVYLILVIFFGNVNP